MMRLLLFQLLALTAWGAQQFDVVVYGGTPGGVAAAISAARLGHSVALIEYHGHLGGMSASGLGKSDIDTREAIGGLFREFTGRVHRYYIARYGARSPQAAQCKEGYYYEPSVAEKIFNEMIAEQPRIKVFTRHALEEALRSGKSVSAIRARNRANNSIEEFRGKVFVDGTYEGDLAAYAGARYRIGRESRAEFNELHAGVVYQDYETRTFLSGTTGEGDKRIQAYTFRLCLTTDPANSHVLRDPPPEYDRTRYLGYLDDWKAGRLGAPKVMKEGLGYFAPTFGTVVRALSIAEIPNNKTDVNMNPRPLGFPFTELNYQYPEADWPTREKITSQIRNITLGLLYFLQNDRDIPAEHRALAQKYHLAKDEFTDNGNFPWQLYVREARRIVGLYTLSENDVTLGPGASRTRLHHDSIAAGEFPMDSFPVRKREKGHNTALEGYLLMLDNITRPYQIPYRIIVPEEVDGLLIPVAASTTHVAFSTIRLEPTWMALGQAAGVAAHLSVTQEKQPRNVNVSELQRMLLRQKQVLTYFKDIDQNHPAYAGVQYFGTRGFFEDYVAAADQPLTGDIARKWLRLALDREVPDQPSHSLLSGEELKALFADAGLPAASLALPAGKVSRSEFCRLLFEALEQAR